MKAVERKKMVAAMELIAKSVNNEEAMMGWLSCGVPDGDIPAGSLDPSDVDDSLIENGTFKDLMTEFLKTMQRAANDGGLYYDGVVSE